MTTGSDSKRKWIIVSNRLPVEASGGLVSAISGIQSPNPKIWVGTAPEGMTAEEWKKRGAGAAGKTLGHAKFDQFIPVFVKRDLYSAYYNNISNDVFWPLLHYETRLVAHFNWDDWEAYIRVNEMFAQEILKIAQPGDLIWIHDFHLFLLPKLLKKKNPRLKIGFFLHVPFPSSEVFRQVPVRREILEALLDADLVGFHDYSYLRHFCSAVHSLLGYESTLLSLRRPHHVTRLGVFPVSIDTEKFETRARSPEVSTVLKELKKNRDTEHLILGVDRLDYIKGIDLKLRAFRHMLAELPRLRGKVALLQIAVPSRTGVPEYIRLKKEIDRLVGEINGEFGGPNYVPVRYIFNSIPFHQLLALYRLADVLLVTSKRDGMNLVALEYLASQDTTDPGVVLLSEFAGAISTLSHVIPINPWDRVETAARLADALSLDGKERIERHRPMLEYLRKYTATDWARSFMAALSKSETLGEVRALERIEVASKGVKLPDSLRKRLSGRSVVLFLDYDGTLVPICQKPEDAVMDGHTKTRLKSAVNTKGLRVVVVSGRSGKFLTEQMKGFGIDLAAEHGARFMSHRSGAWTSLVHSDKNSWYGLALQIMQDYTSRVPESLVEKKDYSVSWHYRRSPSPFADYQARKLTEELEIGLSNLPVTILKGKKVVEARTVEANKGTFLRWYHDRLDEIEDGATIIAIGDDHTDEDLFDVANALGGVSIKVGSSDDTRARYYVESQEHVLSLVREIATLASLSNPKISK